MEKLKGKGSRKSSYEVFVGLMRVGENGQLDSSKVITREGFELWLRSRRVTPKRPADSFRRALTAHVRGADGRRPFPPKVEQAILDMLRHIGGKKSDGTYMCWPCFKHTKRRIGMLGPQTLGYHESKRLKKEAREAKELGELLATTDLGGIDPEKAVPDTEMEPELLSNIETFPWPEMGSNDLLCDVDSTSEAL